MKKIAALTLTCALSLSALLTGCSVERLDNNSNGSTPPAQTDSGSSGDRVVNVVSWGE